MAAPPIGASTRFIPEGTTQFYWVVTLASYLTPTRAELNAGTDLTPEIAAPGNWGIISGSIDATDLATKFTPQIGGRVTVDGPTIDMYASINGVDVRTLLPRGTIGNIVKFDTGDVTGRKMDVFPATVLQQAKPTNITNPSLIQLVFAVTRNPAEGVTVP
jgi:hypothetical protein